MGVLAENVAAFGKRLNNAGVFVTPKAISQEEISHLGALRDVGRMLLPITTMSFGGIGLGWFGIRFAETFFKISPAVANVPLSKLPIEVATPLLIGATAGGFAGVLIGMTIGVRLGGIKPNR